MPDFTYEIVETVAVLSTPKKGWQKELNKVKWGANDAKYDIRLWTSDHERAGKGITLSDEEFEALAEAVKKL